MAGKSNPRPVSHLACQPAWEFQSTASAGDDNSSFIMIGTVSENKIGGLKTTILFDLDTLAWREIRCVKNSFQKRQKKLNEVGRFHTYLP
jgi:hypothetical protein